MAQNRSRRLRKKLHIEEFQELGFTVKWSFAEATDVEQVDSILDQFILQVMEPNGLAFEGSGYLNWEGLICLQKIGKCTEQHRASVQDWLKQHGMQEVVVGELFDIWWD